MNGMLATAASAFFEARNGTGDFDLGDVILTGIVLLEEPERTERSSSRRTTSRPTSDLWTTHFVHEDALGSVRAMTDEEGNFVDARSYEAFGTKNVETGSEALAYGFAGEPLDSTTHLAYHRARWMDSRVGRFQGMDRVPGDLEQPPSLHRYMYAAASPTNNVDPTGLSFSNSNFAYGQAVHLFIQNDFRIRYEGCTFLTEKTIGGITGVPGAGSGRPDLVDRCGKYIYEIKTVDEFTAGVAQIEGYVAALQAADTTPPPPWTPGGPYFPPSTIPLPPLAFAVVFPPEDGVITYQVIDLAPAIALIAIASEGEAEIDTGVAEVVAGTAELGSPF